MSAGTTSSDATSIRALARQHGISHQTLGARLRGGMTLEQATTTPLRLVSRIPEPELCVQDLPEKRRVLSALRRSVELEISDLPADQRVHHRDAANHVIHILAQIEEDLLRQQLLLRSHRPTRQPESSDATQ